MLRRLKDSPSPRYEGMWSIEGFCTKGVMIGDVWKESWVWISEIENVVYREDCIV